MGILNLTPDSFSDGGSYSSVEAAVEHGLKMVDEGAAILDLGGESTRPGSAPVSLETELARVLPVLEKLRPRTPALLSIDTTKAEVARLALDLGADIINDISALRADPAMLKVVAASNCGLVLMHMQGTPETMQKSPAYEDVTAEVTSLLQARLTSCVEAGLDSSRIVLDPGIGFGKTFEHNLQLLRHLENFHRLGRPLLLGCSRKSFLAPFCQPGGTPSTVPPAERHWPGVALTSLGRERGARIFRVHEVRDHLHALRMTEAILHPPTLPA
jgi:dihydropteroate synthase